MKNIGLQSFAIYSLFAGLWINIATVNCRYSASFYGDSFSFESLADYQSSTTVALQFQTQSLNGIILLAAGQEDYLIVSLSDGTIKVKVNVGSGEAVLDSPDGKRYNDLLWHRVRILKTDSSISLQINDIDVSSGLVPTTDTDSRLDIDLGVFLGGYDYNVGASYLDQSMPFFRGCILNAQYNSIDVLDPINNVPGKKSVHNVAAGCSRIFRARKKEPLSFQSSNAYIKFSRWTRSSGATFECSVKTSGEHGLLLFSSGWDISEFIALEMAGGSVRASVNKGSGVIGLQSPQTINDGKWHKLRFTYSPSVLEIRVDRNRTRIFVEQPDDTSNSELNLRGFLFVGGVDLQTRIEAQKYARGIAVSSFPGCIKNTRVNFLPKFVKDIIASHDVSVGCSNTKPFNSEAVQRQVQSNLPTFVIVPHQQQPAQPKYGNNGNSDLHKISNQAQRTVCYSLYTNELQVTEGSATNISHTNLGVQLIDTENQRHVWNDNSLNSFMLKLISIPSNGALRKGEMLLEVGDSFSVESVKDRQVVYEHDGSDTTQDVFSFMVSSDGLSDEMKTMDAKQYRICDNELNFVYNTTTYSLNISIEAVDDPPQLNISPYYVFSPIRNARSPLPKQILQASDPDSTDSKIVYQLIGIGAGLYIEKNDSVGRPVHSFTQHDINEQLLYFVHAGGSDNTRLLLQVSNHNSVMNQPNSAVTALMRIAAVPLVIEVEHNAGLTLVEGEASVITENQLSVSSNAGASIVNMKYVVVDAPLYGKIQLLQGDSVTTGVWTVATMFDAVDLTSLRVRYLNIDTPEDAGPVISDRFKFKVTGAKEESNVYSFNISVLRVIVNIHTLPVMLRGRDTSFVITLRHLSVDVTSLTGLDDGEIQIFIAKSFRRVTLRNRQSDRRLEVASGFTMSELKRGLLVVEINVNEVDPSEKEVDDFMTLYALVRGRYRSSRVHFNLTYIPDATVLKITSGILTVDEGKEQIVTPDLLSAETLLHRRFLFKIVQQPLHGNLTLKGDNSVSPDQQVTSFTTSDIVDGRLHYKHDDGESRNDIFTFSVTPILEGELPDKIASLQNVTGSGTFNISVELINDNPPVRVVNRPFHIARNSERLLTRDDLWYHDADIDQDVLDLVYVRRGLANSDIVDLTNRRKSVFQFTQRDIVSNKILFKHRGNRKFQRFVFSVKDGKHFSTGLFVLISSDPYVKQLNSTKLLVKKGSNATITSGNIQFETNVKGLKSLIKYRLTETPKHGHLKLTSPNLSNITTVDEFTQQNINDMRLVYVQDVTPGDSGELHDSVKFSVTAGDVTVYGNLSIQIYLPSLQQPPVMKRNRVLLVDEGFPITLQRSLLRATHSTALPRNIVFVVTSQPSYGILATNNSGVVKYSVQEFSQWEINHGRVMYIQNQNVSFDVVEPVDTFTYDVSNGVLSLENVTSRVEIIPITIPLRSGNFSVAEGKSRVLVSDFLYIASPHFSNLELDVIVVTQPRHGRLESSRQADVALARFSWRLVLAEFVFYVHDGSDTLQDSYELRVETVDNERRSSVVSTFIEVIPVNDQIPYMVNNTGMTVWVNSVTVVSSDFLSAYDLDSSPADLRYEILPPRNGHLALITDPHQNIINFTQAHINGGQLIFVHKGTNTGGFTFQVNDGLNFDTKHIFVITAQPLVITVDPTTPVQVFPGTVSQFNSSNLFSSTNDRSGSRDVTYHITRKSKIGAIVRQISEGGYAEILNFTQSDVNAGLVYYKQNKDLTSWNDTDDLVITASSSPADDVADVVVSFNVTYEAYRDTGRNSSIQTNTGLRLSEGGKSNITIQLLDASNLLKKVEPYGKRKNFNIKYRIVSLPIHGTLAIDLNTAQDNTTFIHAALERSLLTYSHDGSENAYDKFGFEAFLVSKKRSSERIFSVFDTFHVNVEPVNDNKPQLMTKSPNLQVVQGFIGSLTSSSLRAIDLDSPSSDVVYTIIRAPTYGRIAISSQMQSSTLFGDEVSAFTQQDIDDGLVAFIQNTKSDPIFPVGDKIISDAFYFGLSDGFHRPSFSLFRIKILPVTLNFGSTPIMLQQGHFSLQLTDEHINVTTNGLAESIAFQLKIPPQAGVLYNGDFEVSNFSLDALKAGNVSYLMTKTNFSSDNFTLLASYNRSETSSPNVTRTLHLVISPLITTGNLNVASEGSTSLGLSSLNASELALLAGSMPVYHVITAPLFGDIFVKPEQSNMSHNLQRRSVSESTSTFTHDHVSRGLVYLRAGHVNMTNRSYIEDSFTYRLGVENGLVQPAIGNLPFRIVVQPLEPAFDVQENITVVATNATLNSTQVASTQQDTTSSPDPVTTTHDVRMTTTTPLITTTKRPQDLMEVKDAHDSDLPWLIPLIVAICIILILIIAFVVFCCIRERKLGPSKVKGHETAVKSPPTSRKTKPSHRTDIDAHTHVTVTSRSDTIDSSQRCPTADVVVTPLRGGRPSDDEYDTDTASYDDGYISNSVPPEGLLAAAGMANFSRIRGPGGVSSSLQGFPDPPFAVDVTNQPMLVNEHGHLYASDDSILSDGDETDPFVRRNITGSVGSLPLPGGRGLSIAPVKVNQYWV
uniref:Chondroitin sulfate proteoglycan 4 n=1 Tax=Phallusia mammillata TaxID=59560 RepID=A0A6F9D9D6_9ASCI|nr:chondroitin sulfate proteoglycan 4 [Phallusia mammillata]